jgi:secondary thiamine-phosphate synthase enzyme
MKKIIIDISSVKRIQAINITKEIQRIVDENKIDDGILTVFVPHTTAAVTINESADPDVISDMIKHTSKLIPENSGFSHIEGNSDSHIKTSFFGSNINVIIENGKLILGTWQGIFFMEFDGPRHRKMYIKIIQDA